MCVFVHLYVGVHDVFVFVCLFMYVCFIQVRVVEWLMGLCRMP